LNRCRSGSHYQEEFHVRLKSASSCFRPVLAWAKPLIASCVLALPVSVPAQVLSYAGSQTTFSSTDLTAPAAIALDTSSNAYIVNRNSSNVVKVGASGPPTLITASFTDPDSIAVDSFGNIYVADYGANQVVRLAATGGTTAIGTGISHPTSVAVDPAGDVYIAGTYSGQPQVLKIPVFGAQTVVASGFFTNPVGLAVDSLSNLYVTDTGSLTVPQKVREVTITGSQTNVVTLLTGLTNTAKNIGVDPAGDILLSGGATPYVTMYQVPAQLGSGGTVRQLGTGLSGPAGLAIDSAGTVYVADQTAGQVDVIAPGPVDFGQVNLCPSGGSQTAPCSKSVTLNFNVASGAAITSASARVVTQGGANLDFTSTSNTCIGTLSATCAITVLFEPLAAGVRLGAADVTGSVSTGGIAGATATLLATVPLHGIGLAPLAGFDAGILTAPVTPGDGSYVASVISDPAGNLYYVEGQSPNNTVGQTTPLVGSCVVKKFSVTGATTTVAGTGSCGTPAGDGGPATSAVFLDPWRLALNGRGDLFISDDQAHAIRKVDALTGIITTVAGTLNTAGYSPDGTVASLAKLDSPFALAFDSSGDLYFSDNADQTVRKIDATSGVLITVAGSYTDGCGYSGDMGLATSAQLNDPIGLTLDPAGDLFIADQGNNLVREVSPSTGIITTFAGDATMVSSSACITYAAGGYAGDNGPAASAQLNDPEGLATDAAGNLYIADSSNYVVRKVSAANGIITTVGGTHTGSQQNSGVGGAANLAGLGYIQDVTVDSSGNFYLADRNSNAIDEVTPATGIVNFATATVNTTSSAIDVVVTNDGNAALDLSAVSFGSSSTFNASGADTSCTSSTTLTTGQSCTLGIEFAPTATGALTGALQLTDNAGDNPAATQALTLTGTGGYLATQIVLSAVPSSVALGDNIGTVTASIESSGGVVVTNSTASVTATLTGPGSYSQTVTASAVNGVASLDLSGLPLSTAGTYTLTVTSTGLTSASASVTVSPAATQLVVSGIPASIAPGANLGTATATIESATGAVITTSTAKVTTTVTGPGSYSQTVTATAVNGVATLDLTGLTLTTAGTYTVTTSSPFLKSVTSSVVVAAATFTLTGSGGSTAGSAPTQTVTAGGAATYTFTLAPTSGTYANPVSFAATGLPAGATATFSPATLTPGPTSQTTTLTIQTAASSAAADRLLNRTGSSLAIALGLLLLPFGASRRLRRAVRSAPSLSLMLGLLSLGAVCGLMGCGGGSSSSTTGTTSHTYTVTVTATSGSTSGSTTVTLIVQ